MADTNRPYDLKHHYYMYDIGWLIDKIQAVSDELGQAIDLRTIHYADPINWDITTQYQANTVVVDNKTGVAYISSKNVPAGVLLTNTTYWNPIFNYNDAINKLMATIAYNEQDSPTATTAHAKGSYIYSNAVLYQAIKDIADGDALKVGANIQLVILSDAINTAIEAAIAAAREAVNDEATTRAEADAALSKRIDAEATARADADANYTGTNRISTVTGDDNRTAGDITDTADNIVIHGKRSVLMDSDGTYTEDITGKKKVTADSVEEIYQNTRSIHVVGEQTEAVDSNATKSIYGSYSKTVTGVTTETYNAARDIIGTNSTENYTGKKVITAQDIQFIPGSGALTYGTPVKRGSLRVLAMKKANGEPYNILCEGSTFDYGANVKDFGAKGDGMTDDTAAIQAAINQTDYDTIIIPPGKYHTTKSLKCREGIRVIGYGRNTCEFIDSFATGTFTLANNVFFENLNFETDNNESGFAFYGKGEIFAVNINHVDSLGGYFNKTKSKFLKMSGGWHTLLLNDCIIDCGTVNGYAIELISNGDNTVNKDVQMRDVFCDTWYATGDTAGSILFDSLFGGRLNNCLIRSKSHPVIMQRTNGTGECDINFEYTFFDGDPESSNIIRGMCNYREFDSTYGFNTHLVNEGIMYYWNSDRLISVLYGTNAFTIINPDTAFLNTRANGTFDIVKPATSDITNISLISQGLPNAATWDISSGQSLINDMGAYTLNGMYLNDGVGKLITFGIKYVDGKPTLAVMSHANAQTAGVDLKATAWNVTDNLWLSIQHRDVWNFLISNDGVSWLLFYSMPLSSFSAIGIGMAIDTGAANANITNVKQWHIEVY